MALLNVTSASSTFRSAACELTQDGFVAPGGCTPDIDKLSFGSCFAFALAKVGVIALNAQRGWGEGRVQEREVEGHREHIDTTNY